MRKTGHRVRSGRAEVDAPVPETNCSSATKVVRALDSSFTPSRNKQPPPPPTDLGICAFRSGRQIGSEPDLKKLFRLSIQRAVNSSSKRDLAARAKANEPNRPADATQPLKEVGRGVPIRASSIVGEPDLLYMEGNCTRQPTTTPSPQNSSPPLAPNLSHALASVATERLQVRTSAEHLLMEATSAQQRVDTLATQVGTPSRSHSPSNPCADDAIVDMAAAGPIACSAEMGLRSPHRFVSVHSLLSTKVAYLNQLWLM